MRRDRRRHRSTTTCRPTATQAELEAVVDRFNADPPSTSILVQLPLPEGIDEAAVLLRVDPTKDVDGLHPVNLGRLVMGAPGPLPCTPAGIVELLAAYEVPVEGRHVVIIGRGLTIGRPLALLLALKRPGCNAAVTVVHTGVQDLARPHAPRRRRRRRGRARRARSPPTWCARRRGRGRGHELGGQKLLSDVADDVAEVAGWITPRLGGVGPMTRAMLLRNAVAAAERARLSAADAIGREQAEQPWGSFTVLDESCSTTRSSGSSCAPGKRLSYQRHAQRAEHWFVVSGARHRDPRRASRSSWPRARASTSPSDRRTGARTAGSTPVVFVEVQARRPTSARTTSSGSKTTSGAPT